MAQRGSEVCKGPPNELVLKCPSQLCPLRAGLDVSVQHGLVPRSRALVCKGLHACQKEMLVRVLKHGLCWGEPRSRGMLQEGELSKQRSEFRCLR